nr:formin-like protein 20 [Manis javanica]
MSQRSPVSTPAASRQATGSGSGCNLRIPETDPPRLGQDFYTPSTLRKPSPASAAALEPPTPAPRPLVPSRRAGSAPVSSPPRCLGAPQSPALPPAPPPLPPPRPASTGVPEGDHTSAPRPHSPPPARPLGQPGPTHGCAASARAKERELEHRRPPSPRASPGSRGGLPDLPAGGGGAAAAQPPHSPGSRQPPPVPTVVLACSPARRAFPRTQSRRAGPRPRGAHQASLSAAAHPAARPSSAGSLCAPARGGRPARLRTPLHRPAAEAAGRCSLTVFPCELWPAANEQS